MGFAIIETAIGLILVFLVMSLICSALREMIESLFKQRALDLERGLRELLNDPDGKGLTRALYSHPLVFGLFSGKYTPARLDGKLNIWFGTGRNLPSYIPTATFARALVDLHRAGKINEIYHPEIHELIQVLADGSHDTLQIRQNVEEWFDGAAERMSGWYKRRTYAVLLIVGVATAVFFNVNAIVIAHELYNRADLRSAIATSAEKFVAAQGTTAGTPQGGDETDCPRPSELVNVDSNTPVSERRAQCALSVSVQELNALAAEGLPVGWRKQGFLNRIQTDYGTNLGYFVVALGWLATGLSVTFGAPFWFDTLNKFVAVRSTIKGSKSTSQTVAQPSPAPSIVPASVAIPQSAVADVRPAGNGHPAQPTVTAFEPNRWRNFVPGEEEGDL
jgi:hypothetical protein